jgi:2-amino-4-hydroxy-6-hydroxymethyldihydropteridine diphosphokinase
MSTALVAIGSNLGDRRQQLDRARELLGSLPATTLRVASNWHETAPVGGPAGQGAFLNGALLLETSLAPEPLRQAFARVELELGRERDVRWQARRLDIDLLLYDELVVSTPELVVPHPRMAFRRFVLEPAVEIAPTLVHPLIGWTMARLLENLNRRETYLAITGVPGAGKTRLVAELAVRANLRPLAGPPAPQSELPAGASSDRACAGRLGSASPAPAREIEFFRRRAQLIDGAGWPADRGAAGDFWLEQSLAYASLALDGEAFARLEAEAYAAASRVVQPKLLVLLTVPERGGTEPAGSEAAAAGEYRLQDAIRRFANRPGVGPLIEVSSADWTRVFEDVSAALSAMQ